MLQSMWSQTVGHDLGTEQQQQQTLKETVQSCAISFKVQDFPGDSVVKNLLFNAGDIVQSLVWEDPTSWNN